MNHYEELGLSSNAPEDEIRKAYRRAVKLIHPDQYLDPATKALAERQMIRLNGLAQTLLNPESRREYDLQLLGVEPGFQDSRPEFAWAPQLPRIHHRRNQTRRLWIYGSVAAVVVVVLVLALGDYSFDFSRSPSNYAARDSSNGSTKTPPPETGTSQVASDENLLRALEAKFKAEIEEREAAKSKLPQTKGASNPEKPSAPEPDAAASSAKPKPSQRSVLVVGLVSPKAPAPKPVVVEPPPSEPAGSTDDALANFPPVGNHSATAPAAFGGAAPSAPPFGTVKPVLIKSVPPAYPAIARDLRIAGTVEFAASIGKDGAVRSVQLLRGPELLVDSARAAVVQWRYRPATLGGVPVDSRITVAVVFRLN